MAAPPLHRSRKASASYSPRECFIEKTMDWCYTKLRKAVEKVEFYSIMSDEDIQFFLEQTNSLHDGHIIGVQYTNDALTHVDENGYYTNPNAKKLILRILVTSICDTIVEIEFDSTLEWQIQDDQADITDTSVIFNEQNFIVWSDNFYINEKELKKGSYVIADSMKWRIVE